MVFGWLWVLAGLLTGLLLGLRFQREDWLGGYASWRRRMIRLGHISFLGLGFLNILFALSADHVHLGRPWFAVASAALVAGGLTMPLCCGLMAWRRNAQPLFAVPVVNLLLGVTLIVTGLLRP